MRSVADGVLINMARGSLVDEKALIEALRNKTILAAGLDVFENEPNVPQELIKLDNAVLLPHVGSASVKTRQAMAECVVSNVFAWADGKAPLHSSARDAMAGSVGEGRVGARWFGVDPKPSLRAKRSNPELSGALRLLDRRVASLLAIVSWSLGRKVCP